MRLIAERFLTCTTLMLAASSVFAEVPPTARLLNGTVTTAPAATIVVTAHVTAPAIAWPVVHAPAQMEIVHIAPGATTTISSETALPTANGTMPAVVTAIAEPPPPPKPTLLVDIDLSTQRMTVSENGAAKYTWAISSARSGYRTPTGSFKPTWMSKMWYSRQYDMAPMPHAVFFSGGVAIHATYATGMLGNPASHGCVRLAPKNAATFYSLVAKHSKDLTRIAVHGTPRANGPAMASNRRKSLQRYAYGPNGYIMVQNGYQVYGTTQGKVQQRRPYYPAQYSGQYGVTLPGKKLKVAQRTTVASSNSGFGYGFGGF